jgi:hypothetical protein
VTEKYTEDGQAKEFKTSSSTQVHYNDSYRDVRDLGIRYLTQLFPNFSVSPRDAVQDFSDSCPGKQAEFEDVVGNRANYRIQSGTFEPGPVTLQPNNFAATSAEVSGPCVFVDIPTNPALPFFNQRERVTGICTLTAVYENFTWKLCTSRYRSTGPNTPASLRYRVPGSISSSESSEQPQR